MTVLSIWDQVQPHWTGAGFPVLLATPKTWNVLNRFRIQSRKKLTKLCCSGNRLPKIHGGFQLLVGGLEHEFYDFPYIGNNHPNWLSYFLEGFKPPTRLYYIPYITNRNQQKSIVLGPFLVEIDESWAKLTPTSVKRDALRPEVRPCDAGQRCIGVL